MHQPYVLAAQQPLGYPRLFHDATVASHEQRRDLVANDDDKSDEIRTMESESYKTYYDERRDETYAQDYGAMHAKDHPAHRELLRFIERYGLENKKCLEIGSSGGFFQDLVEDYYGTDIAESLRKFYHKPYRVAEGTRYPFDDEMFDGIWTVHVFEHIPALQEALMEIKRLLKPGGYVFFKPAWQCRPWAADGYAVRPYSDFGLKGKLIKASIPVRDSKLWRSMFVVPKRLYRHAMSTSGLRSYERIRYRKIKPNYEHYWTSDSDACNHIDPHDAILWFNAHGFDCVSHPMHLKALTVVTGALIFRKGSA